MTVPDFTHLTEIAEPPDHAEMVEAQRRDLRAQLDRALADLRDARRRGDEQAAERYSSQTLPTLWLRARVLGGFPSALHDKIVVRRVHLRDRVPALAWFATQGWVTPPRRSFEKKLREFVHRLVCDGIEVPEHLASVDLRLVITAAP